MFNLFSVMFHFMEKVGDASEAIFDGRREERLKDYEEYLENHPPLINREFLPTIVFEIDNVQDQNPSFPFRVLQWNILADALSQSSPTSNFHVVPPACLEWTFRKIRILEHILKLNPDIICLEEVDHCEDTFQPVLEDIGYELASFVPKKESPCLKFPGNNGPDGVALFYKTVRFKCLQCHTRYLLNEGEETNQPLLACLLVDKTNDTDLCVAVTHYKAKDGFVNLRKAQGIDTLREIKELKETFPNAGVLICGDFNAVPTEPVYSVMEQDSALMLTSAYKTALGTEIPYSTWKIRENIEYKKAIDYIWFSPDVLDVISVLDVPNENEISTQRFPSFSQPSDHLALCCDFVIKQQKTTHSDNQVDGQSCTMF